MNLSYTLLMFTVLVCLLIKNRGLKFFAIMTTVIVALFQGIIHFAGIFFILLFFAICHAYFAYDNFNKFAKSILLIIIIALITGFTFHAIPGFSNALVIDKLRLSPLSCPFSMYLNFDKVISALILYTNLSISEKFVDKNSLFQTILSLSLCIGVMILLGLLSGYIELDPKVPDILGIWILNNLLFVCMAEEVIFRGFLQNSLKSFLVKKVNTNHLHIIVTSIVFGLAHFKGGMAYIILASIAGGFYGYVYEKTNRIFCAMLIHFGLNLVHLIIFTYPAAINMCMSITQKTS